MTDAPAQRTHLAAHLLFILKPGLAADRDSETLTRVQRVERVPAQVFGFGVQWAHTLGARRTARATRPEVNARAGARRRRRRAAGGNSP